MRCHDYIRSNQSGRRRGHFRGKGNPFRGGSPFRNLGNPFRRGSGLYRSRQGMFLGVCRGLAEYFDFSVGWVRALTVIAFIFTGFWPVGILYLILGLVMKPEPVIRPADADAEEFYNSYADSRAGAVGRLKRTFDRLERRLRRLEDAVTSKEFHWEQRARQ